METDQSLIASRSAPVTAAAATIAHTYGLILQSKRLMLYSAERRFQVSRDPGLDQRATYLRESAEHAAHEQHRWTLASTEPPDGAFRNAAFGLLIQLGESAIEEFRSGAREATAADRWQIINVDIPGLSAMVERWRSGLRPEVVPV